jgi:hypothetical protein
MPARSRALFAALAIALLAVLLPASASAAYKTTVVVSLKFPAFHGKVKSPRSSCVGGRTVKLYRKLNGSATLLGTDTTNDNGKWSIPISKKRLTPGLYYAKAPARGDCKADKSSSFPIA